MNYQDVLLTAFDRIPANRLESELIQALQHSRIQPHLAILKYATVKHNLLQNYSQALQVAAKHERVSGFFRGSLGTMLSSTLDKNHVAEILGIDRRSVTRSLQLAQENLQNKIITGKHNKLVRKTNYTVNRLPVQPSIITNWILSHCRASANSANVVRQRDANGTWSFQIMHYRDSSIDELFKEYKVCFFFNARRVHFLNPFCRPNSLTVLVPRHFIL